MDFGGVDENAHVIHNVGEQGANLSDVVELILSEEPTLGSGLPAGAPGSALQAAPEPAAALPPPGTGAMQASPPYVYIVEQPAPKSLRFRYECEGRSAGSIPGVHSTPESKTFPSIKVCGYKGCMVIVVSCVTKEEPYKPHPHNLVGRDCQMGVCTVKVKTEGDAEQCQVQFKNLGIQCVKRRDISEALRVRQDLRVNPFKTGYSHKSQPQSIDLNAVRLCFQVFLTDESYKVQRALQPVVSEVVYDKKAMSDLLIVRSSHCSGPVRGGTTVILLCEKVTREDTEIWFFHEEWTERVPPEFVHKQLALVFKTPPYRDKQLAEPVTVQFQLHRVSDGAKSNVYTFEYIPDGQDVQSIVHFKRRKLPSSTLQEYEERHGHLGEIPSIKAEPRDRTSPHNVMSQAYAEQWAGAGAGASHMAWYPPTPDYLLPPQQNVASMQMQHMQVPIRSPLGHASPLGHVSPMGHVSPLGHVSPMHATQLGHVSPMNQVSPMGQQCVSPMGQQCVSPMGQQCVSPMGQQCVSPMGQQCVSPMGQAQQCLSPLQQCVSPQLQGMPMQMPAGVMHMPNNMGDVLGDVQPTYTQMDTTVNSNSLSHLLMNAEGDEVPFTSGDLSNLSSMLADRPDLSDSLNRLSTRDLLQP